MEKTKNNGIKYFIYARRSSESEDRQMASIESQIDELKKIATHDKLEIVDILYESRSAKEPGRPVFNKMLQRLHKGEANGIICWKLNRLARNPVDGGQISWILQQGVVKHIATYGRDYYPSDNVIMMAVELGMANQFIRDLSTDTKRGLRSKAERGWYPNYTTLGYIHNPLKKKGEREVIKDPDRFNLVRKMFEFMMTGKYSPHQTVKIANEEWGLRTKAGRKVARSTIYRIFTDPFYYGEFEYPGKSGNWYHGSHTPMITRDEYERIQKLIHRRNNPRSKKLNFACRGPLFCGECGAMVTAENKIKRQKNGNVHFYTYYRCTKKKYPNCTQKAITEPELVKEVNKVLGEIEIPEGFYKWAMENLKEHHAGEFLSKEEVISRQRAEYDRVSKKISNLIEMRAGGELTEEEFTEKKSILQQEKNRLASKLDGTDSNTTDWLATAEQYLLLAEKARKKFEIGSIEDKKSILKDLGSDLFLKDQKLSTVLVKPLNAIKKSLRVIEDEKVKFGPVSPLYNNTFMANRQLLLPLVPIFRTANWAKIKSELHFSDILNLFPFLIN